MPHERVDVRAKQAEVARPHPSSVVHHVNVRDPCKGLRVHTPAPRARSTVPSILPAVHSKMRPLTLMDILLIAGGDAREETLGPGETAGMFFGP
jgi:hypothetical protein